MAEVLDLARGDSSTGQTGGSIRKRGSLSPATARTEYLPSGSRVNEPSSGALEYCLANISAIVLRHHGEYQSRVLCWAIGVPLKEMEEEYAPPTRICARP